MARKIEINSIQYDVLNQLVDFSIEARKNGILALEGYLKKSELSKIPSVNKELESLIFEGVTDNDFTKISMINLDYAELLNLAFSKIQKREELEVGNLIFTLENEE